MSSYRYIIAEALLQRTKAETVAKFYPIFLKRFPSWKSIDVASLKEVESFIKPIGLQKQRSKLMKKLAHQMVLLNGRLPKEKNELEKIPYFGQYIVNSIILFIQKKPAPLLDVNMSRVLERIFGKRKLADIRNDKYLQKLSHEIVDNKYSREMNWAILDFAALVCKPNPQCENCILNTYCCFYKIRN